MSEQVTANGLAEGLALLIESVRESNQGQRQRFLIMDSQLRLLNELAGRLEKLEGDCIDCNFHTDIHLYTMGLDYSRLGAGPRSVAVPDGWASLIVWQWQR